MWGGIDPGGHQYRPPCVGVAGASRIFDPGMGPYLPVSGCLMLDLWLEYWGVHTVRGIIDPGEHRFRPGWLEL